MAFNPDEVLAMDAQMRGPSEQKGFNVDDVLAMEKGLKPQSQSGAWNYLMSKAVPGGGNLDALGALARGGQSLNNGIQKVIGSGVDKLGQMGVNPTVAAGLGTIPATISEAVIPQTRFGVAATVAPYVGKAIGAAGEGASMIGQKLGLIDEAAQGASKPGFWASLSQGMARLKPADTQYYIDHPEEIQNALSIKDAGSAYKAAIGDLQGKTSSLAEKLNKTVISEGDYTDAINRAGRLLNGTEVDAAGNKVPLTPQDALDGLQSINQALRDKQFTKALSSDRAAPIYELKNNLMDWMENNGTPGLRQAAKDLRLAHIKDEFSNWLPQNKYGSTDALRTFLGVKALLSAAGAGGGYAAGGFPALGIGAVGGAAAGLAGISPKMWGAGINNANALAQPETQAGLGILMRALNNYKQGQSNATGQP